MPKRAAMLSSVRIASVRQIVIDFFVLRNYNVYFCSAQFFGSAYNGFRFDFFRSLLSSLALFDCCDFVHGAGICLTYLFIRNYMSKPIFAIDVKTKKKLSTVSNRLLQTSPPVCSVQARRRAKPLLTILRLSCSRGTSPFSKCQSTLCPPATNNFDRCK